MNFKILKTAFFFLALVVVMASCNKATDVKQQYLRGGNSLAFADDGSLIVAGYNTSASKGYEATLVKVNATSSDTIWSRKFGGTYSDAFYSVKNSHEGGTIAVGFSNRASAGSPSMFAVITDALGTTVKSLLYGGTAYTQAFSVVANADSGYLLAGYIQKTTSTDRDIYLVRINNAGTVIWEKSLGAKSNDQYDTVNDAAYGVIAAPDGGYFVTGTLNGYSSNGGKIFLMKVSSTGDSLWTKTYGSGIGYSLTLAADNSVAISGSKIDGNSQDVFLLKTDTAGIQKWKYTYGGTGFEYGATMVETTDGGFAITGVTESLGAGLQDVYLVKTSVSGNKLWEKTYGGTDVDQGFGLVQNILGDFYITGLSNSGGSFIFLNKTDMSGTQIWKKEIQ